MRPPVPDVALRRARKSSIEQQWTEPRNTSTAPATFFLARSRDRNAEEELSPGESVPSRDSMYGVQSLEEAVLDANPPASECEPFPWGGNSDSTTLIGQQQPPPRDYLDNGDNDATSLPRRKSTLKPSDLLNASRLEISLPSSDRTSPRPLTPSNLSNPDDPSFSLPSSPKSFSNQSLRHLDDISITDDISSEIVASGEEDNNFPTPSNTCLDSASQLVMPSIRMPSRRPFTERGKSLGRLKVLIAGASGTGKTSLIKSIVQACEDIVHVDPFPSLPLSKSTRSPGSSSHSFQTRSSPPSITEIYASTKPYPLLRAMTSLNSANHDFQNMLAGNGGAQVDTVLYLISEDIESIRKLCDWTNVIPVISKSDLLSCSRVSALKSTFHKQAQEANIKPFLFGDVSLGEVNGLNVQCPFAVSSAKSDDDDVMDASTLMSPDYVQPLMASELMILVQMLFDRENITWMRHLSAKKLALRQQEQSYWQQDGLPNDVLPGGHTLRGGSSSYTMARISDYTRHEERLARVQLARWASDLQQSLRNERERYATIARGDRAVWLTERLGECVVDGSLVPISQTPGFCGLGVPAEKAGSGILVRTQNGKRVECRIARISPHDPLGLVWWSEDLKRRGWAIIQIETSALDWAIPCEAAAIM
ncbi:hypothetical protein BDV38DRAFT_273262 [Aspergillus pseudotamarii]|uniref:Septin-type G domain-containing protein n=1 Tax=Aspergillus pseudotamarii TaxID=132259 RepID=A0A5N6SJL8_ASPPS|nr:uncharacterized protein BDV38DRAFT_273262 [Aspergillus pseudotamarii]KAE8134882.1 hypothetical protein BDV38DRAFT_273262 [Aspergillus pseudotamarii]